MIVSMAQLEIDNEEIFIRLVKEGNKHALRAFYERHVRYLAGICSRYIYCEEDVKDVLQDAFIKIFSSINTFEYRGEGSVKAWISRVVLNESLKFLRNKSHLTFFELKQCDMDISDEDPDTEGIPPEIIHSMIRELPDGYRTIFNLYVIDGKSHKEIAGLLGIREDSSASQLHRAKALLIKKIKQYKKLYSVS